MTAVAIVLTEDAKAGDTVLVDLSTALATPAPGHDTYEDVITDPQSRATRARTGRVDDDRDLVAFLYLLARDSVPMGSIEQAARLEVGAYAGERQFTNGHLARWAQDLADRLVPVPAQQGDVHYDGDAEKGWMYFDIDVVAFSDEEWELRKSVIRQSIETNDQIREDANAHPDGLITDHAWTPVLGHPDDPECTHRSDGTDATYCSEPEYRHRDSLR